MVWIASRDLSARIANAWAQNTSIGSGSKQIILISAPAALSNNASLLDLIRYEAPQANGYTRRTYTPAASAFDAGQNRAEVPSTDFTFTAAGGTIPFNYIVILSNITTTLANRATVSIDAANSKLNFDLTTAHSFAANDRVTVTADPGGTVPAALLDGSSNPQLLFVRNQIDTSGERSIQLSLTSGGTPITFTGGSGTLRVRTVPTGAQWDFYDYQGPQVFGSSSIANGDLRTFRVALNFGEGSTDVNAL